MGLVKFLQNSIKKRPILTNTVIYATFYSAAEMSQQTYNKYYTVEKSEYDVVSAARIVAVGSSVYAPTLTVWYRFLDKKFTGQAIKAVASKVCLDQFFMSPILMAAFYTCLGVLESREDPLDELKAKFVKTFIANQVFWLPVQSVNFYLVSPHLRVAYVASMSFMWINVLCFIKRQKS